LARKKKTSALPAAAPKLDKTTFERDDAQTPQDRNDQLADLLLNARNPLMIVSIRRIEIGSEHGWEATFRT
jgi:hypothetical protein